MGVLRDTRSMTRGREVVDDDGLARNLVITTEEEAREAWEEYVAKGRCYYATDKTAPTTAKDPVVAYVNESRWVADCPECNSGMPTCPEFAHCFCSGCGTIYEATHPKPAVIRQAELVLEQRPETNRNWHPDREDVRDLKAENATRGIPFAVT